MSWLARLAMRIEAMNRANRKLFAIPIAILPVVLIAIQLISPSEPCTQPQGLLLLVAIDLLLLLGMVLAS